MICLISQRTSCRVTVLSGLLFTFLAAPPTVQAGQVPGMQIDVSLKAREQPVDEFLNQLFGQAGVPTIVDPHVSGTVNGDWMDTAANLHAQTMRTFQLVTYFDGVVAYVYKLKNMTQVVLPVNRKTALAIIALAKGMQLPDEHNRLKVAGDSGLVVSGTPRFIEQVKELSVTVRKNTKKYVPKMVEKLFELKTSWAHDTTVEVGDTRVFVPGMVSILNDLIAGKPISATAEERSSSVPQQLQQLGGSAGLIASSVKKETAADKTRIPAQSEINMDEFDSSGVRIVAVPNLNAVLIRDYENRMKSYETLIASLDVEPYMLEIEATIIDLNSDRSREFGVNWRLQSDDGNEALVGNGTITDQLLRPDTVITPQGQGGVLSLALGNQAEKFLARIRALENEGDAEIISKPHVVTLSNEEAVLDTTQSFFVRVAGVEEASLYKITAGTTLRVTPHVYKVDGDFRIKLMVNISDGATTDATVDQIPVIGQSRISTQAIVKAGDSLLVGGLVRESKRDAVTKVPLLGDLPGLGSMFRSRSNSGTKVERMFLITPRIAYRNNANDIRMDAPLVQGQMNDVIKMSVRRREDARESLASVVAARHEVARSFPAAPADPVIAPLPEPDLLVADDGRRVKSDGNQVVKHQPDSAGWTKQELKALLRVPPPPIPAAEISPAVPVESAVVASVPVISTKKKWTVQALPEALESIRPAVDSPAQQPAPAQIWSSTKVSLNGEAVSASAPTLIRQKPKKGILSSDDTWLEVGQ
ncbi:MAG: type III secretion system outer membrane ring subunit SctC [Granulosicoccus sp.]|nr:type III secretion system outer membrane ring subunit SctC [Granulosicoccus sp.]